MGIWPDWHLKSTYIKTFERFRVIFFRVFPNKRIERRNWKREEENYVFASSALSDFRKRSPSKDAIFRSHNDRENGFSFVVCLSLCVRENSPQSRCQISVSMCSRLYIIRTYVSRVCMCIVYMYVRILFFILFFDVMKLSCATSIKWTVTGRIDPLWCSIRIRSANRSWMELIGSSLALSTRSRITKSGITIGRAVLLSPVRDMENAPFSICRSAYGKIGTC